LDFSGNPSIIRGSNCRGPADAVQRAVDVIGIMNYALNGVGKSEIVDKSAVSDCAIEHFDLLSVHIPTFTNVF